MNALSDSLYHSALRVGAVTLTATLLFVSGVLSPQTQHITLIAEDYVANAISASAGVAPTELNQITAALTEQERALEERAATLRERELAIGLTETQTTSWWQGELTTWLNSALLFCVLVLMVINYVLDFSYRRRSQPTPVHNTTSA